MGGVSHEFRGWSIPDSTPTSIRKEGRETDVSESLKSSPERCRSKSLAMAGEEEEYGNGTREGEGEEEEEAGEERW